jgi:hypothetical protein
MPSCSKAIEASVVELAARAVGAPDTLSASGSGSR